jgi:hypothetical protein
MSSGGPSTEESSLSSLALPILGAKLICKRGVLVVLGFFELDVGVIVEVKHERCMFPVSRRSTKTSNTL